MKRKVISVIILFILACVILCACGGSDTSSSQYAGKWVLTAAEGNGLEIPFPPDDEEDDWEYSINLQSDGKATSSLIGESDSEIHNGTWSENDSEIIFHFDDIDQVIILAKDGDRLAWTDGNGVIWYFEKEKNLIS